MHILPQSAAPTILISYKYLTMLPLLHFVRIESSGSSQAWHSRPSPRWHPLAAFHLLLLAYPGVIIILYRMCISTRLNISDVRLSAASHDGLQHRMFPEFCIGNVAQVSRLCGGRILPTSHMSVIQSWCLRRCKRCILHICF